MKNLWIGWFVALIVLAHSAGAQTDDRQKIESAKTSLITNRLKLSAEQAPQFWAVYNDYNGRKQELNRQIRQLSNEPSRGGQNNNQLVDRLREVNATRQKLADLDNEYMSRFLKVITPAQLTELYRTERDFNRILLERLQQNN